MAALEAATAIERNGRSNQPPAKWLDAR
jgi:hypothetical protein